MNYNTDFMYHIGNIIYDLRREADLSQRQICYGLCSDAEYSRIERGEKVPDPFLLEYILQRLGKSADYFEYVLKDEHYLLYELREQIHQAIREKKYDQAKEKLCFYGKQKGAKKAVHRQYVYKLRALMSIQQDGDILTAMEWISQAIELTIPMREGEIITSYTISIQELQLILMQIEIKTTQQCDRETIKNHLYHLLEYVDDHYSDTHEKAKVYPVIVLLLKRVVEQEEYKTLDSITKQALELLTRNGIAINLVEILGLRIEVMKEKKDDPETIRMLELQRDAVEVVVKKYGEKIDEWILVSVMSREFYLDWEIIKSNRLSHNMTQEDVCENICTQETLSRIETRKRSPHSVKFKDLTNRMGIKRDFISSCVMASQFKVLEKKRELERYTHYYKWDEVEKCLEGLEAYHFPQVEENEQFFLYQRTMINFRFKKITHEQAVRQLEDAIKLTLKNYKEIDLGKSILTRQEVEILCSIAIIYATMGYKEESMKLIQLLLDSFKKGHMDIRYHTKTVLLLMNNLATHLEEANRFEEALALSEEGVQWKLRCGRINAVGRFLTERAYTMERMQIEGQSIPENPMEVYKQAFYITNLLEEGHQHQTLVKYLGDECKGW